MATWLQRMLCLQRALSHSVLSIEGSMDFLVLLLLCGYSATMYAVVSEGSFVTIEGVIRYEVAPVILKSSRNLSSYQYSRTLGLPGSSVARSSSLRQNTVSTLRQYRKRRE